MESLIFVIVMYLMTLIQARPQPQNNFVLWSYFPFLHHQPMQMMQPANMPRMAPASPLHQYPTFEMLFNGPIPINNNMPIIGEVQFQVAVPPRTTTQRPTTSTTKKRRPCPRQAPTSTTTARATTSTRQAKRQTSVKKSPPLMTEALKSQLSKGIFEMARQIQANILSQDNHQQSSKFHVFSPINVAAVLSLLELGAKGQTNRELQDILGFDKLKPSECSLDRHRALGQMFESVLHPETPAEEAAQINMAKGIFMQTGYSMRPDYRTSVETIYQSHITALDFQQQPAEATKFINDWVQQQTNGKIVNILADGIDKSTRMMVASAVYFKALWTSPFISAATSKRPFYPNGREGPKLMVDTMGNGGEFMFYESKAYDCSIMALQFKGQTTTMYIILPNKSNPEKLKKLQATLTSEIIDDMISKMQMRTSLLTLPKMHLTETVNLMDVLRQLKVHSVFQGGRSDLSGITENNQLSLDGFMHKVDLTINESGTEAAAVTTTHLSREDFEVEFRVDSPFMFLVRHDVTKLPIFYGSVIEPINSA